MSGAETVISCDVTGLIEELDAVAWEKESGEEITPSMSDYEVSEGSYDSGTQTTTLTVKNGINTADSVYKCAVTRTGLTTKKTSVNLKIFSEFLPVGA